MNYSYIKESIDEVKQYLDKVNNKDKFNKEFEEYYLKEQQDIKNNVIGKGKYWYNSLSENVKGILDGSKLYSYQIENIREKVLWELAKLCGDYQTGYKGSFSIQFPAILTQLCKIYEVKIEDKIYTKLGNSLDWKLELSAQAELSDGILTVKANSKMVDEWRKKESIADELSKACQNLLTELRKKIVEKHNGKFDFLKPLLDGDDIKKLKLEWDDNAVYDLVSQLDEFKSSVKRMFLDKFKKNNEANDFDAKLKQPTPDLFNLLKDKNLETYINEYKEKSLEERKKDPLRQVFRWNSSTRCYQLDNITQKQTIQQWFTSFMPGIVQKETKDDIYYVLLELFGKDFEFGGYQYEDNGGTKTIPKSKLWDKVDKEAVKAWYKEKKIQTDLFDDLQIEEEIVITEKQNGNNINSTTEENKSFMKNKNFNMDTSKENKEKNGTEKKQSKTSKTGYKIGLGLDILVTILFVYLGISNLLFLLALIITVPVGIYCARKSCRCCLSSHDNKIKSSYYNNDVDYSATIEPECVPEQNDISNKTTETKSVKIVTKDDFD